MSVKRLAALLLLAALVQAPLWGDDFFPKSKSVFPANATPMPASISGPNALFASPESVSVIPASGQTQPKAAKSAKPAKPTLASPAKTAEPVMPVAYLPRATDVVRARPASAALPLPTGYTMVGDEAVPASPSCGAGGCGSRGSCLSRLKAWLCYYPTAGDALPKLRPHPYVGPVLAFRCDGAGCGGAYGFGGGCANGCGGSVGLGGRVGGSVASGARGCKTGCVPPADDAVAGYKFAGVPNSVVAGVPSVGASYATYATYKPTQTVGPVVNQTGGSVLARPYTKP